MKIDDLNYYSLAANMEYLSATQFKDFMDCEARAKARVDGRYVEEPTKPLLMGGYLDAMFEGTADIFEYTNAQYLMTKSGYLRAEYTKVKEIYDRLQQDKLFMEFMSGQKQTIMTGELNGVKWKIKMDSYFPGDKIVDLKLIRNMDRIMGKSFIEYWGYDIQGAIYQAIEGNKLPFYLAVATKETVTDIELIHINQATLDLALERVLENQDRIVKIKNGEIEPERCGSCDYCKFTKILTAPIDSDFTGFQEPTLKYMKENYDI